MRDCLAPGALASVQAALDDSAGELPTAAYLHVRTNRLGETLHHSTGRRTAEANQELFVLKKDDHGTWRIARYSFSPTAPPG